jgi:hypothetical protein
MEYVINNYHKAVEKGKNLKDLVYEEYTWSHATERIAKRVEEIYQEKQ